MTKNWRDATFRYAIGGFFGSFFPDYLNNQKVPFVFLDIGANQGLFSIIAAKNTCCQQVIAFEPVHYTFKLLEQNVNLNQVVAKCRCIRLGLGEEARSTTIFIPQNHSGAASEVNHLAVDRARTEERIEIVSSEYLNEMRICQNGERLLCKIDVEGRELGVLRALAGSDLMATIDEIFYEVNESWVEPDEIRKLLKSVGFAKFQHIGHNERQYDVLATRS